MRSLRDNIGRMPLMETLASSANEERPEMPPNEQVERLFHLGWLRSDDVAEISDFERRVAITSYQTFHGLQADGWVGPQTERSMELPRVCALPDVLSMGATLAKWAMLDVKVFCEGSLANFGREATIAALQNIIGAWNKVCGIRLAMTDSKAGANIVVNFGPIDRAGQTLAWSELPGGNRPQLNQLYDSFESWVISMNPGMSQIDFLRVGKHEFGHAIGIGHIQAGLLAPTYSQTVSEPQATDIAEAVARYGPPTVTPPPPPIDPPPPPPVDPTGRTTAAFTVQGKIISASVPGFRVTPVS